MKKVINLGAIALLMMGGVSMMQKQDALKEAAANSYKVIRVNGKIVFVKTESPMKQGDLYVDGTDINFSTEQSRAAIINKLKGRCVLSPAKKGKAIVLPAANNISSRSGALINEIDIKNHFSDNYLVINKMMVEVGGEKFVQNDKNFFYLSYSYNGEVIRKKLPYIGNKMVLDRDEIFKVDEKPIPVQNVPMDLFYMSEKEGVKLASFKPVFPDLDNLKAEVLIIMNESAEKSNEKQVKEITAYLNEFYGKPQKENLADWLSSEFQM